MRSGKYGAITAEGGAADQAAAGDESACRGVLVWCMGHYRALLDEDVQEIYAPEKIPCET
jgi:hypothetical protein